MIYNKGYIFLCSQANLSVCFNLHTVKWTFLVYSSLSFNPCLDLCNYCHGQCAEQFCRLPNFPLELSVKPSLPPPHPLATTDLFILVGLSFPKCHISGIIQYVAFWAWLLSVSMMSLGIFHVDISIICSFLLWNKYLWNGYSIACLSFPIKGHLGFFRFFG